MSMQQGESVIATLPEHHSLVQHLLHALSSIICCNSVWTNDKYCLCRSSHQHDNDNRKMRQVRCEAPIFSALVEVIDHENYLVHTDVAASVDAILAGRQPAPRFGPE